MNEIYNLQDASNVLGINSLAIKHMTQFNIVNETAIIEDLQNGLLYEWLKFIDLYTDSNTNNHERKILGLFLSVLSSNFNILVTQIELGRMESNDRYPGRVTFLILDQKGYELSRLNTNLNYYQYLFFKNRAQ